MSYPVNFRCEHPVKFSAALDKGDTISPAEEDSAAKQLSANTRLSTTYIKEANLRIELGRFRKELLRDERHTTDRYDSRFEGVDADAAGENASYDPSDTGIQGAFASSFNDDLIKDLDYHTT